MSSSSSLLLHKALNENDVVNEFEGCNKCVFNNTGIIINKDECTVVIQSLMELAVCVDVISIIIKHSKVFLYYKERLTKEPYWISSDFSSNIIKKTYIDWVKMKGCTFTSCNRHTGKYTNDYQDYLDACYTLSKYSSLRGDNAVSVSMVSVRINNINKFHDIWYIIETGVYYAFQDEKAFEFCPGFDYNTERFHEQAMPDLEQSYTYNYD